MSKRQAVMPCGSPSTLRRYRRGHAGDGSNRSGVHDDGRRRRAAQVDAAADAHHGGEQVGLAARPAVERGDGHPAGGAGQAHYAASKAGMVAMTKTIARAYARDGVLAFAICPGFTMTGMAEDYLSSRGGDALLADIPLGKVADPAEVASVARYCALEAPPSMTGAVIDVNGASYVR